MTIDAIIFISPTVNHVDLLPISLRISIRKASFVNSSVSHPEISIHGNIIVHQSHPVIIKP